VNLPRGIWCVLSGLAAAEIRSRGAAALDAGASALSLRRPACGSGAAAAAFAAPELQAAWRATHGMGDVALASGARAVIAGARSLDVADYLRLDARLRVGASAHDMEEARFARDAGAHFLIFGPVWDTPEKSGRLEPRGPAGLAAAAALGLPVIAIGGILAAEQVRAACAAGAHACAVLRAAAAPAQLSELTRAAAACSPS